MKKNWSEKDIYLCNDNKCYYYKFMSNNGKNEHIEIVDMQYFEGTKQLKSFCSLSQNPSFYRTFYNFSMLRTTIDDKTVNKFIQEAYSRGVPLMMV